ncbi:MAG: hypothetical protein ABIZ80_10785, partial [Bryobacteraceae bacterium]
LQQTGSPRVRLVGEGKSAIWATFAASVSGVRVSLEAEWPQFSGADQDFLDHFFVPGILRAGGIEAARSLLR